MKRFRVPVLLAFLAMALPAGSCGPLFSVACDRVGTYCTNVDLAVCDALMDIAPPRVRSEIVDCTAKAKSCQDAVDCFSAHGYSLTTINSSRY
jgi:hypothetical protein